MMSDEQNRPPGSDSLRRIPSSGSLDSIDQSMTDFDTFQPDSQEFSDPGDDLHVSIAVLLYLLWLTCLRFFRFAVLATIVTLVMVISMVSASAVNVAVGSHAIRCVIVMASKHDVYGKPSLTLLVALLHGYESGCSPFVSSDNEAISMANISSGLSYAMNDQSVDDLLVEPRHSRDSMYTSRDKTTPRSGGSPEPGMLQQQASSRPGIPKLVARRNGAGESPRHNWFPSSSSAVSGESSRLHSTGSQSGQGATGREKRISRTSRRPSRLGSQTDSNDESSDHDLMVRSAYSTDAHSKPPTTANGSQQDGEYRKSLHGSPRFLSLGSTHTGSRRRISRSAEVVVCQVPLEGGATAVKVPTPAEWLAGAPS
ncbi:unnamed protein product [Dibothriocephalus latus]|uniref:Uncharacterized protein n=1 Tax=Dibothriocephalus latus TaxID=60516 RepID=A0A3P7L5L8_DIBLA|nr:unnamed protein product [Dibothriocephalus latus]